VVLDKRKIRLERAIRSVGEHEIEMHLHGDVVTTLKLKVESSTPVAVAAVVPAPETRESAKGGKEPAGKGKPDIRPDRAERKPRTAKPVKSE
ncbi:MAG: 50S ribosomal L9 C-terminal domain-containing protein, partial [Burkholderiales bacterium]